MSRNRFREIKSKIKLSKTEDANDKDNAWKVRKILNLFRQNIQQCGFFSTALSVDEMMVRFFGRTSLKQYLPCKPDRYGIKLWGLCAANGYLFNLDVYCGKKDSSIGINLLACALGSRVVLQMINPLFNGLSRKNLSDYHLYFDNFFTSPDLLIHLHKCGLRSTGTVRKDRVKEKHEFAKNDPRGSYKVTCGITPITSVKRFSRAAQERAELGFPRAFSLYNNYIGGVDLHDFICKKNASFSTCSEISITMPWFIRSG
ncbi:piggyBac transposable element-derived protein 3-like [Belonocnema kinseyi]|uniref:piggyBac transposable element-derived protein 3-like n=1 Tax=Belonocnema kinseyi TaxID=2817044 RepID=UPI00143D998A|nr:piggyBac transposable element-derived protein 3-like [Belonocnema kinseyi]